MFWDWWYHVFVGKSSQRDVKQQDDGEIDSDDTDGGVGEQSDSNEASNKNDNVMSIPKKHSNGK